jgi:hypothetical protein
MRISGLTNELCLLGDGKAMLLVDVDSPADLSVMSQMNFSKTQLEPFVTLNWAAAQKDYKRSELPILTEEEIKMVKNPKEKEKFIKRKEARDAEDRNREELFEGNFDWQVVDLIGNSFELTCDLLAC